MNHKFLRVDVICFCDGVRKKNPGQFLLPPTLDALPRYLTKKDQHTNTPTPTPTPTATHGAPQQEGHVQSFQNENGKGTSPPLNGRKSGRLPGTVIG